MQPLIDDGRPFDWGRAAADYAAYRDLYPDAYYELVTDLGVGRGGQRVLDLGTGTGVLPRHLQHLGAEWLGVDMSPQQIAQARQLSAGMNVRYLAAAAEELQLPDEDFDAVTAAQCFFYFDHGRLAPVLRRLMKPRGRLLITYLSWLPEEDPLAAASEALVLRFNPDWSGGGEVFRPVEIPEEYTDGFRLVRSVEERWDLPFTRESWHGRMRACRGTGASLDPVQMAAWEREHQALLETAAPAAFTVRHCLAAALLEKT